MSQETAGKSARATSLAPHFFAWPNLGPLPVSALGIGEVFEEVACDAFDWHAVCTHMHEHTHWHTKRARTGSLTARPSSPLLRPSIPLLRPSSPLFSRSLLPLARPFHQHQTSPPTCTPASRSKGQQAREATLVDREQAKRARELPHRPWGREFCSKPQRGDVPGVSVGPLAAVCMVRGRDSDRIKSESREKETREAGKHKQGKRDRQEKQNTHTARERE